MDDQETVEVIVLVRRSGRVVRRRSYPPSLWEGVGGVPAWLPEGATAYSAPGDGHYYLGGQEVAATAFFQSRPSDGFTFDSASISAGVGLLPEANFTLDLTAYGATGAVLIVERTIADDTIQPGQIEIYNAAATDAVQLLDEFSGGALWMNFNLSDYGAAGVTLGPNKFALLIKASGIWLSVNGGDAIECSASLSDFSWIGWGPTGGTTTAITLQSAAGVDAFDLPSLS